MTNKIHEINTILIVKGKKLDRTRNKGRNFVKHKPDNRLVHALIVSIFLFWVMDIMFREEDVSH